MRVGALPRLIMESIRPPCLPHVKHAHACSLSRTNGDGSRPLQPRCPRTGINVRAWLDVWPEGDLPAMLSLVPAGLRRLTDPSARVWRSVPPRPKHSPSPRPRCLSRHDHTANFPPVRPQVLPEPMLHTPLSIAAKWLTEILRGPPARWPAPSGRPEQVQRRQYAGRGQASGRSRLGSRIHTRSGTIMTAATRL